MDRGKRRKVRDGAQRAGARAVADVGSDSAGRLGSSPSNVWPSLYKIARRSGNDLFTSAAAASQSCRYARFSLGPAHRTQALNSMMGSLARAKFLGEQIRC